MGFFLLGFIQKEMKKLRRYYVHKNYMRKEHFEYECIKMCKSDDVKGLERKIERLENKIERRLSYDGRCKYDRDW